MVILEWNYQLFGAGATHGTATLVDVTPDELEALIFALHAEIEFPMPLNGTAFSVLIRSINMTTSNAKQVETRLEWVAVP